MVFVRLCETTHKPLFRFHYVTFNTTTTIDDNIRSDRICCTSSSDSFMIQDCFSFFLFYKLTIKIIKLCF